MGPLRCPSVPPCPLSGLVKAVPPARSNARHAFRLKLIDEPDRLDCFGGQQGRHAGIQRFAQVRRPVAIGRHRMQQLAGVLQHRLQLADRLHLLAGHAEDQRKIVGRVGKGHRRFVALFPPTPGAAWFQLPSPERLRPEWHV